MTTTQSARPSESQVYQRFFEHAPDAVLLVDAEGTIVLANARAQAMFGYERAELCGGPVERLVAPALRDVHVEHRLGFVAHPEARPMGARHDLVALRRDGSELPVDIMLAPIEGPAGESLVMAVVRDITDRRRREDEARSLHRTSARQAAQLEALNRASLALVSHHDIAWILQEVVEAARAVIGARYGALAMFDDDGRILRFLTSGLAPEDRERMSELPKGRGLLGAVLAEDRAIRVDDLAKDRRSSGFPAGHPPMTSFIGVPIRARGRVHGNLYLTDRLDGEAVVGFDASDERILQMIAAQAAVAVENARLYATAQSLATVAERERIARELHDSLAQVLGYVRIQAGLARGALDGDQLDLARQAVERIDEAVVDAYADVREAILGLRSHLGEARDLAGVLGMYLERYRLQSGVVAELEVDQAARQLKLEPGAEAQLLRIIQEALSNVRKHASASRVAVRLVRAAEAAGATLRAEVVDDGQGFDAEQPTTGVRFGLATMRERAQAAGGWLEIRSRIGGGTSVLVELPASVPAPSVLPEG